MNASALAAPEPDRCFHCELPIPAGCDFGAVINEAWRPMCCPGCQAVAQTIAEHGFEAYYARREGPAERASDDGPIELAVFDDPEIQRDFVTRDGDSAEATLSIEGLRCAACAWLIERHLGRLPGVAAANVSLATHRALVRFDATRISVSALLLALREIGYAGHPYEPDREAQLRERERRNAIVRLGVAGLGAMQVMMFSVGLYAGALDGMEPIYRSLLRHASLLVSTFVVTIGARPFFEAAWRDLRARQLGMDVPVALAIGVAYVASAFATFEGTGEVYFDSVCMFTFFLSLGRFLEGRAREASAEQVRDLARRVPAVATRVEGEARRPVPVRALRRGDIVLVRPGESIPVDGRVVEGESAVSEALWTGEEAPRQKGPGDAVIGGSPNLRALLTVEVERSSSEGTLASIRRLLDRAQAEKPAVAKLADRAARVFVGAVLAVAGVTALVWWQKSPDDALWVTLSVLVATCPCALSLATPAALAAATESLARRGFLSTRGHTLETLARVSRFTFDKTGTLTSAQLELGEVIVLDERAGDRDALLRLGARLEHDSIHPISSAFRDVEEAELPGRVQSLRCVDGQGVEARVDERTTRLGRPAWVGALFAATVSVPQGDAPVTWILLGDTRGPLAWISLRAELREDAARTIAALRSLHIESSLSSGDPSQSEVDRIGRELGIDDRLAGASPADKVEAVRALQRHGEVVAAVGDGVNDAPLLGVAQVSIAIASGADLARVSADAVLTGERLGVLAEAVTTARRTRRVIRQNLVWAAGYNALALPLAVTGNLPPYLAAIGMSASSLVVVCNALRLRRIRGGLAT